MPNELFCELPLVEARRPLDLPPDLLGIYKAGVALLNAHILFSGLASAISDPLLWVEAELFKDQRQQKLDNFLGHVDIVEAMARAVIDARNECRPITADYLDEVATARSKFTGPYKCKLDLPVNDDLRVREVASAFQLLCNLKSLFIQTVGQFSDAIPIKFLDQIPADERIDAVRPVLIQAATSAAALPRIADSSRLHEELIREVFAVKKLRDDGGSWQNLGNSSPAKESADGKRSFDEVKVSQAIEFVRQTSPANVKQIANAIGVSEPTCNSNYMPELKRRGIEKSGGKYIYTAIVDPPSEKTYLRAISRKLS
jgi:hypothetical protein